MVVKRLRRLDTFILAWSISAAPAETPRVSSPATSWCGCTEELKASFASMSGRGTARLYKCFKSAAGSTESSDPDKCSTSSSKAASWACMGLDILVELLLST